MLNVLIVDHEADTSDTLADHLESHGYRVRVACSGRDALISIERDLPDVAIVDLALPDMPGHEVCVLLRRACPSLRAVVATSGQSGSTAEHLLSASAEAFVGKPYAVSAVRDAIARALAPGPLSARLARARPAPAIDAALALA